jgi:hypothetical protein
MNENDEDVVHAGIVSKSQKIPEFRPFLEFATDTAAPSRIFRRISRNAVCTATKRLRVPGLRRRWTRGPEG